MIRHPAAPGQGSDGVHDVAGAGVEIAVARVPVAAARECRSGSRLARIRLRFAASAAPPGTLAISTQRPRSVHRRPPTMRPRQAPSPGASHRRAQHIEVLAHEASSPSRSPAQAWSSSSPSVRSRPPRRPRCARGDRARAPPARPRRDARTRRLRRHHRRDPRPDRCAGDGASASRGCRLAQIAEQQKVDPQKLIDALAAQWSARIDARLAVGALTADQAKTLKDNVAVQAKAMVYQATLGGMRGAAVGAGPNGTMRGMGGGAGDGANGMAGAGRGGMMRGAGAGNGTCPMASTAPSS